MRDASFESWVARCDTPLQNFSDNGSQFVRKVFEQICQQLDIAHIKRFPYRPQSNKAEHINNNLVQITSANIGTSHNIWDQYLSRFVYTLRTSVLALTGKIPFKLFLGKTVITPPYKD